jgi:PLP dependent protein
MLDIKANYHTIMERISAAATKCGRDPKEIKLLAATKAQDAGKIRVAIEAGVKLVGENYVQEGREKKASMKETVEWHMIGHLQRNKAKATIEVFDLIQSLDSFTLAKALDKEGEKRGKKVRTFVEVNLGGEETKSGVARGQVRELLEAIGGLSYLSVEGLMAVPPFREDPEEIRPYFRALKQLRQELQAIKISNVVLNELSMGMTHDYPIAVEEGATMVRIGTALFGPRTP